MCSACVSSFEIRTNKLEKGFISGYSFTDYSSESAAVVNAVKEQGQTSLVKVMAEFMTKSWPEEYRQVQLVPIPSSPSNLKRRGFSHTELLAKKLSLGLDSVRVAHLLRSVRPRVDQVGLSFPEREQNLIGAFKADLRLFREELGPVVLIDDVFTSGATLSQAWQCLGDLGVVVAGFCVFAQITPRKPLFTGQERLS